MSDRLDELRRQRELQREHLDWLDREIAALEGTALHEAGSGLPPPLAGAPAGSADAEAILEEYRRAPASIARRTKTGCLLYFAAAMGLLAMALVLIYLFERARRGH